MTYQLESKHVSAREINLFNVMVWLIQYIHVVMAKGVTALYNRNVRYNPEEPPFSSNRTEN